MFPFELEDEELVDIDNREEVTDEPPVEYGIDFKTGRLTGGKVTGAKAVAVWAYNALLTPRYRYDSVSWEYGCELSDLIGQVLEAEVAAAMAEAIVRDCFSQNPNIEDIRDFSCRLDADTAYVSMTIETPYGEEELTDVVIRG